MATALDGWVCPWDGAALLPAPALPSPARLNCAGCGRWFPVLDGIPSFTEPGALEPQQQVEMARRDRELEPPDGPRLRYDRRVELEAVLRRLPHASAGLVLDAGCGTGHAVRPLLQRGYQVCALDFSLQRLQHLQRHAPLPGQLALAAADLNHMPLPAASCAAIINMQVLEHLPTAAARRALLASFAHLLRPGGVLVLTVYNFNESWRRRGIPAEGYHPSGIFYHCYQAAELHGELTAAGLEVLEVRGLIHLLPHTYRLLPALGAAGRWFDHRLHAYPALGWRWGRLLLARARRPL